MAATPSFDDLPLDAVSKVVHFDHHHRGVGSGRPRAAVFGASDGLVSNAALILGVAAADPSAGVVRLAGIAGLIAGAVSMAAGEYISMKSQAELFERELRVEREAQRANPELETWELTKIYEARGMEPELAADLASAMMRDPDVALEVHAREELGIDPAELGAPAGAALWSLIAFAFGAGLPLLPWIFGGGAAAIVGTIVLGMAGALALGATVGALSGRPLLRSALRQAMIASSAALITYGIGSVVGVGV